MSSNKLMFIDNIGGAPFSPGEQGMDRYDTLRAVRHSTLLPLQYRSTVSMAHFLSVAHLIRADPVILFSTGHQPCHR